MEINYEDISSILTPEDEKAIRESTPYFAKVEGVHLPVVSALVKEAITQSTASQSSDEARKP